MIFSKNKDGATDIKQLVSSSGLHHIAFIMDGNGRWAKKRSLPREAGHPQGAANLRRIVRYCGDIGIDTVTVYAFSTENWKRPEKEVSAIMKLLDSYISDAVTENDENNVRYIFLGDKKGLEDELEKRCLDLERLTENNRLTLNIALNYGGRDEIVHAVNTLISEGKTHLTEDDISSALYTRLSKDPDLIVRTAGELRISNFLLWQGAYSEFYFTDVLWPDFNSRCVDDAVIEFSKRKRRFGGV